LSFRQWLPVAIKLNTFQDENTETAHTDSDIRTAGFKKMMRGIAKISFIKFILIQLYPSDISDLLSMPIFSLKGLFLTYILAFRIYCMMGLSDVVMGIVQMATAIRFKDIFDNPFISISPKDFWR
ncbi:hypothetical protein BDB01DRAFT_699167, partial [Pilobolus umbonatus]